MDENPEQVRQYVEDDNKAIVNFFIGQTMKKSNRQANPNKSLELIKQELEKRKQNEKTSYGHAGSDADNDNSCRLFKWW